MKNPLLIHFNRVNAAKPIRAMTIEDQKIAAIRPQSRFQQLLENPIPKDELAQIFKRAAKNFWANDEERQKLDENYLFFFYILDMMLRPEMFESPDRSQNWMMNSRTKRYAMLILAVQDEHYDRFIDMMVEFATFEKLLSGDCEANDQIIGIMAIIRKAAQEYADGLADRMDEDAREAAAREQKSG